MHRQPLLGVGLVGTEALADIRMEDLGPAPREGVEPRRHQPPEHLLDAQAEASGERVDLDRGEAFEMHLRKGLAERPKHPLVPLEGMGGMDPSHDVEFRDSPLLASVERLPHDLLVGEFPSAVGATRGAREGAERATRGADVGVVDMSVAVVKDLLAMHARADHVGHGGEGMEVVGLEQADGVLVGQSVAEQDLLVQVHDRRGAQEGLHESHIATPATTRYSTAT